MKMQRYYFVSDSLDDLEILEEQLEAAGIPMPQIHVLSPSEGEVERHRHLHEVQSLMRSDLVHTTIRAAVIGIAAFVLVLVTAHFSGLPRTAVGWVPFVFFAIVVLGFVTWEGGLIGIQKPNHNFARFEQALRDGKHLFFVDLEPQQEAVLKEALKTHPSVQQAGTGSSGPHWLVTFQRRVGTLRHT